MHMLINITFCSHQITTAQTLNPLVIFYFLSNFIIHLFISIQLAMYVHKLSTYADNCFIMQANNSATICI